MMQEVNPAETTRAYAFEMWMKAPMPMVTLFRTIDVSNLRKVSKRKGLKFNMLMCWCIGRAASQVKEFYMLPVGDRLVRYDSIAVNTIVANKMEEVSSCDIPFCDDLAEFNRSYLRLTRQVAESCKNHDIADSMVIGTSALAEYEIDGAVGMYSGVFNNPFMIWGALPQEQVQNIIDRIIPIPSHPDGRCPCRPLPRFASKGDIFDEKLRPLLIGIRAKKRQAKA